MPLQITFQSPTGDNYATAYARVVRLLMDLRGPAVRIEVAIYRNQAAAANRTPVDLRSYQVEGPDAATYFAPAVLAQAGVQPITQAEAWLKATQSEFAGATDA